MTLKKLIKEQEGVRCQYVQTDNIGLHWFIEKSLTEWAQKDRLLWNNSCVKGKKDVIIYKLFNEKCVFENFMAVNNTKQTQLHICNDYEGMACWIDVYKISNKI